MMKKLLLAIACLLAMGGTITSQAQNLNHAYGDVNLDGEITVADVNAVINIILGGNGNLNTADVNNDGEVTIADINIIIDLILHPTRIPEDVHVYGDTPGSEGSVWLVTDETVVVSCPPGQEPEVGDIIVSGVTEYAPYGFLRRVESVERSRGQCVMTTTNASLEEVLPDGEYHIDIPLILPGQQSTFNNSAEAPSRVKFSTDFRGTVKIGWKGDVPDIKFDVWPFMTPEQEKKKEDEVLNGEVDSSYPLQFIAKVSPSLDLSFDCGIKHRKLQRLELSGELEVTAELLLKATLEKEFKRVGENGLILPCSIDMAPITVMAGAVPVVFTPKLHFSLGVDLKGELYMQFKLMSATASGTFTYVYTRDPDPVTGHQHNFYTDFEATTLGDGDWGKRFQKWLAPKVGVRGSAKGILTPMPDVSVYNANDIFHVSVPLSPWAKVGGNLSITLDPSNSSELDYEDNVTLTGGADIGIAAVFKLFGKKEVWEKDFTLFETELMEPFALTPRFDELRVTPDEDPIPATTPAIEFGAYMTKPNIQVLTDQDYGFAYGPKDAVNRTATWTFVSLKDQYDPEFDGDWYKHQYIQTAIDPAFVEPGVPYRVSPYLQLFGYKIFKKGADFTLDDATPCVTVPAAEIDFGDVLIGFSPTQSLEIVNSSSIPQTVTVEVTPPFSIAHNESSMSSLTVEVPANSFSPVTIMFPALSEGDYLGTATFTSKAIESGSCVIPLHGRGVTEVDEHEYVDLGLPSGTLWATCNVGASAPEDYGDYFAWGETAPKNYYDWGTLKWYINGYQDASGNWHSGGFTKYCTNSDYGYNGFTDGKTELDHEDDAAYVNWGSLWRMPTVEQQRELVEQCTWTWTQQNGVNGQLVTGPNGNTLFFPAAGHRWDESLSGVGTFGSYWSRTLGPDGSNYACSPEFYAYELWWGNSDCRYYGHTVRAVRASEEPQTETFTVNGVSFKMVAVEGGTFWMGTNDGYTWAEQPKRQVTLSSYSIGQTEVTNALWGAVMPHPYNSSTDELPVDGDTGGNINSDYAFQEFIMRLSGLTGRSFRLPTVAEWEYAARGGKYSHGYVYAGSDDIGEVAWYNGNSYDENAVDYPLHPVAQKQPNELNLYDMSGNVTEACLDSYFYDYNSYATTNNPYHTGSSWEELKMCRGGSTSAREWNCRVLKNDNYFRFGYHTGARLACSEEVEVPIDYHSCPNDDHPHLIDLGLPSGTKWACCNIGGNSPEDFGKYYARGEIEEKELYNWENYSHVLWGIENICGTSYDVATVKWGAEWQTPSKEQILELLDGCFFAGVTINGVRGMKFTSRSNGASIFLPAAGYRIDSNLYGTNSFGSYLSGTRESDNVRGMFNLFFDLRYPYWCDGVSDFGQSVRPVRVPEEQHEYVDLGLPSGTLWATCNIGANAPEEYGNYFAWGETAPKDYYDLSTYKWCEGSVNTLTKYCYDSSYGYNGFTDGKSELDPEDDAAYVNWGPSWRMPSMEQQRELDEQCTWTWTTRNEVKGCLVTGPNGNTIFLPAAGYRENESLDDADSWGRYWSRALSPYGSYNAFGLSFDSDGAAVRYYYHGGREHGLPVRAVRVP